MPNVCISREEITVSEMNISKNSAGEKSKYPVLFGLAHRVCDENGTWSVKIAWGRVAAFLALSAIILYSAVVLAIYVFMRYFKSYTEMTVVDAITMPFNRQAFREQMGDFNVNEAKEYFKNGKFREGYMSLVAGCGRNPKNLDGVKLLSELYLVSFRRSDRAVELLERSLPYGVNDIQYVRLYMKILMERAEDARLVGVAGKLLSMKTLKNEEVKLYLAMSLATIHAYHGNYAKSKEYITEYGLDKSLPGILRLSKNEWELGNRDAAIKILADGINFPKNKEAIYALLVNYYSAMKDYDTARRYSMLRSLENPFSMEQRMEYLDLLKKSGDTEAMKRDMEIFFKEYQDDNRSILYLANFVADIGDLKFMRRIYDLALQKNFSIAPYCLLLLETTINEGDYKSAVAFVEDIMKTKPKWKERHEDVVLCLRAVTYYAVGNLNMADILTNDIVKRNNIPVKVLISTARMFERLGGANNALKILERAVALYPSSQMALTRLIQTELRMGISTDMYTHVMRLIKMRRPPRELIADARNSICSDKFVYIAERDSIIKEIDYLMNNRASVFTEGENANNMQSESDFNF